jgi:hypothetical protein
MHTVITRLVHKDSVANFLYKLTNETWGGI